MSQFANKTIPEYFYAWEKNTPENVFLKQPFNSNYKEYTWREAGQQIRKIVSYLDSLKLPAKSNIAIISKNCAEWILSDLAIMISGHVSVPLYPTLTADQLNYVLSHSECRVAFIGKLDDWQSMKSGVPNGVLCIDFPNYNPEKGHIQWNDILRDYPVMQGDIYPKLDEIMSIIYTSGTTGNPKGVVVSFKAFADCIYNTREFTYMDRKNTKFFSYLPLSHIAERNIVESLCIITGGTIFFPESLDTFAKNLQDAEPTHFLAVPRIWAKFQQGILAKMPQKKLDLLLKIPIINSIIKKKIRKGLGLGNTWMNVTGAAPMPTSLIQWYRKIGINIQEAYGMTENLGAVCMMPHNTIKDGYVGKVYPNMEIKIDPNTGEILNRSSWNMLGYYKEPKLTAEAIDNEGWLHTGDVGELDKDNFLKITGRVKELYKTSKGEYIAPSQIEMAFSQNTVIDQICLVGQMLPQPIALVVVSESGKNLSREELIENLTESLKTVNPTLKSFEKVKKLVVLKEAWTVENNKMTPTLKIKRNIIEKEFESKFEFWYNSSDKIVFE